MEIAGKKVGEDLIVIAEIGNNHEGSYTLAEELIGQAAQAGAHVVKFQTFQTKGFIRPEDKVRYEKLKSFELSFQDFERLSQVAKQQGITFLSTPLDIESAKFLNSISDAFKIASGDNLFFPLLETVAQFQKPTLLSTGMTTVSEIRRSKDYLENIWSQKQTQPGLALLHCVSSYPVPAEQANLGAIQTMQGEFDCHIGYSDHTLGIEAALTAVSLGARVIEKHFTLRHDYSDFRDHQLSADPGELAQLVQGAERIITLLGDGKKEAQACEVNGIEAFRRSIALNRDMDPGETIQWEDLVWLRPGTGFRPGDEELVVGKQVTRKVLRGELLLQEMLEEAETNKCA